MTENEIRKYIEELREKARLFSKSGYATAGMEKAFNKSADTIENLLNELEAYRAIGLTPELIEAMQGHNIAMINDLGEYQSIGTIDEFKDLKEKAEPKKIIAKKKTQSYLGTDYYCPTCHKRQLTAYIKVKGDDYCKDCGQHFDWSE